MRDKFEEENEIDEEIFDDEGLVVGLGKIICFRDYNGNYFFRQIIYYDKSNKRYQKKYTGVIDDDGTRTYYKVPLLESDYKVFENIKTINIKDDFYYYKSIENKKVGDRVKSPKGNDSTIVGIWDEDKIKEIIEKQDDELILADGFKLHNHLIVYCSNEKRDDEYLLLHKYTYLFQIRYSLSEILEINEDFTEDEKNMLRVSYEILNIDLLEQMYILGYSYGHNGFVRNKRKILGDSGDYNIIGIIKPQTLFDELKIGNPNIEEKGRQKTFRNV